MIHPTSPANVGIMRLSSMCVVNTSTAVAVADMSSTVCHEDMKKSPHTMLVTNMAKVPSFDFPR